jgi:hypothetical protein
MRRNAPASVTRETLLLRRTRFTGHLVGERGDHVITA